MQVCVCAYKPLLQINAKLLKYLQKSFHSKIWLYYVFCVVTTRKSILRV